MSDDSADQSGEPQSAAARLFDIRLLIGGLFSLYGVMLTVAGLFTSEAARQKASGININLWLGIGMLVLGLLFLLWQRLGQRPGQPPGKQPGQPSGQQPGQPSGQPPGKGH